MSDNQFEPFGAMVDRLNASRVAARTPAQQKTDHATAYLNQINQARDQQIAQLGQTEQGRKVLAGHGITVTAQKVPMPHPKPKTKQASTTPNTKTYQPPQTQSQNGNNSSVATPPTPSEKPQSKQKWVNPTGQAERGCDPQGCGQFGARRQGGARNHTGIDYNATPGQDVVAVTGGKVKRLGKAYAGDNRYDLVVIETPEGYEVRQLYLKPKAGIVGSQIQAGDVVGSAQDLRQKYPGITPHIHVDVSKNKEKFDPSVLY